MSSRFIVACRVMELELEEVRQGDSNIEILYLDQVLHRTPEKMTGLVQEAVDSVPDDAKEVVLCYGLCSNGIAGVVARKQGLFVPKCHDCIPLLMGSRTLHDRYFNERPGTYYLTRGWIQEKKDPIGIVEDDYTPRVGREMAIWVMEEELKNYTHITLIVSGHSDLEPYRKRAKENAAFFKKQYDEIQGSLDYFQMIVYGPFDPDNFLRIAPGEAIKQEMFFCEIAAC